MSGAVEDRVRSAPEVDRPHGGLPVHVGLVDAPPDAGLRRIRRWPTPNGGYRPATDRRRHASDTASRLSARVHWWRSHRARRTRPPVAGRTSCEVGELKAAMADARSSTSSSCGAFLRSSCRRRGDCWPWTCTRSPYSGGSRWCAPHVFRRRRQCGACSTSTAATRRATVATSAIQPTTAAAPELARSAAGHGLRRPCGS
jgi:hypothetical protein